MDITPGTVHQIRTAAEQADARYSATIAARTGGRRDRWTLTKAEAQLPEIAEAYRIKVCADEALRAVMVAARGSAAR